MRRWLAAWAVHLRMGDGLVLAAALAFCVGSALVLWQGGRPDKAIIKAGGQVFAEVDLSAPRIVEVPGPLGTTRNISWGLSWLEHQTGVVMSTDALVRWPYDLTAAPRLLSADIEATDADALALKEWMRACGGAVKPTVMVPDQSDPDPMFGYLTNGSGVAPISPSVQVLQQQDTHQFIDSRLMRIAIEEITAGDPEWY